MLQLYPRGVVSIVADTFDFWNIVTNVCAELKDEILSRKPNEFGLAKTVFRPDSGDPVKIVCGDENEEFGSPAYKGAIGCLWDVFGGTTTSTGHKLLNERVGLIYGDSITLDRASRILARLDELGFASANVIFGVGSFTYNYNTRDTFGHAYKCTFGQVNGELRELFKDPVTDSGSKKSAKGLIRIEREDGDFVLYDQQSWAEEGDGELRVVFENGEPFNVEKLSTIRARLHGD